MKQNRISLAHMAAAVLSVSLLTACGGAQGGTSAASSTAASAPTTEDDNQFAF